MSKDGLVDERLRERVKNLEVFERFVRKYFTPSRFNANALLGKPDEDWRLGVDCLDGFIQDAEMYNLLGGLDDDVDPVNASNYPENPRIKVTGNTREVDAGIPVSNQIDVVPTSPGNSGRESAIGSGDEKAGRDQGEWNMDSFTAMLEVQEECLSHQPCRDSMIREIVVKWRKRVIDKLEHARTMDEDK